MTVILVFIALGCLLKFAEDDARLSVSNERLLFGVCLASLVLALVWEVLS